MLRLMTSRDPEGRDRGIPGAREGLGSAETQHDPSAEIAVARTLESGDIPPGDSGIPR